MSKIIFLPRFDHYLDQNENTVFTIMKENGEEEDCGTLTGTNTESTTAADQTYEISCAEKSGVGLKVWRRETDQAWCVAEIEISYADREY